MRFKGKVVLITGASSGIGRETALRMAKEGATLAAVGRDSDALGAVVGEVLGAGGEAHAFPTDMLREDDVRALVGKVVGRFGKLDVLINGAGIIQSAGIEKTTAEDWDRMMSVNLRSVFLLTQAAVPELVKTRGNVVNISSVTGTRAFPGVLTYCVSKAGLDQFTRCVALELADRGVRVNSVNPGVVVTNLHRRGGMDEKTYQGFLERAGTITPLQRVGEPWEVAEAIMYLASDAAGWVTGHCINIDGGRHQTCMR